MTTTHGPIDYIESFLSAENAVLRACGDSDRRAYEAAVQRLGDFVDPTLPKLDQLGYENKAADRKSPAAAAWYLERPTRVPFILRIYERPGSLSLWWFHISSFNSQKRIGAYFLAEVRPDGPRIIAQGQPCPPCDAQGLFEGGVLCETCNGQGWNEMVSRKGMPPVDLVALGPPVYVERLREPRPEKDREFCAKDDPFNWLR